MTSIHWGKISKVNGSHQNASPNKVGDVQNTACERRTVTAFQYLETATTCLPHLFFSALSCPVFSDLRWTCSGKMYEVIARMEIMK